MKPLWIAIFVQAALCASSDSKAETTDQTLGSDCPKVSPNGEELEYVDADEVTEFKDAESNETKAAGYYTTKALCSWDSQWRDIHNPRYLHRDTLLCDGRGDYPSQSVSVQHGYRPPLAPTACFISAFMMHNELLNIWTHWIPSILYLIYLISKIVSPPKASTTDLLVYWGFLVGCAICFGLSGFYHTLLAHRINGHPLYIRALDYCGTGVFGFVSSACTTYYLLYNQPERRTIYLTTITILYVTQWIYPWVFTSFYLGNSTPRSIFYFVTNVAATCLAVQSFYYNSWEFLVQAQVWYYIAAIVIMISAYIPFMFDVPDRYFPDKLVFFFQGHQLWHILTVVSSFLIHLFHKNLIEARAATPTRPQ